MSSARTMLRSASRRPAKLAVRSYSQPTRPSHPQNGGRVQQRPPYRPSVPPHRSLAQLRPDLHVEHAFLPTATVLMSPTAPRCLNGHQPDSGDYKPPDERILKLGKTLRTLSTHLPTLLIDPLPQEILSPTISLHLFPSTHPHLPVVKGKVPYRAALWTAPVAWGSMPSLPLIGNVKLRILSERMVPTASIAEFDDHGEGCGDEKLVVRWITDCGESRKDDGEKTDRSSGSSSSTAESTSSASSSSSISASSASSSTNKRLSTLLGGETPIFKLGKGEEFAGLFIFSFDAEGRIRSHTIEHADENSGWDRTSKVVSLTDWLLGKAKWGGRDPEPALASALDAGDGRLVFRRRIPDTGSYRTAS